MASIDADGWALLSGEERHRAHPETFVIPTRDERERLNPGDAAQLLFDIETRVSGRVVDRGVDRLWVIVRRRIDGGYAGVLDSDPGRAKGLDLKPGHHIEFTAEHVVRIERPPREYVVEKFGPDFFQN